MRAQHFLLSTALVLVPSLSSAQPVTVTGTEPGASPPGAAVINPVHVTWDHRYQVGLRAGLTQGYQFTVRYHDGPDIDPCDALSNKFCAGASPLMLDTALGFGVTQGLELEARFRMGVLTNYDNSRPTQVGLGFRALSDPETRLKFYIGLALLADVTSGRLRSGRDYDFAVRAEEGLQYDVERWFGVYLCLGESFEVLRNFSTIVDGQLGVQFRAPP